MAQTRLGEHGLTVVARRNHGARARRAIWRTMAHPEDEPERAARGLHHGLLLSAMAWLLLGLLALTFARVM